MLQRAPDLIVEGLDKLARGGLEGFNNRATRDIRAFDTAANDEEYTEQDSNDKAAINDLVSTVEARHILGRYSIADKDPELAYTLTGT